MDLKAWGLPLTEQQRPALAAVDHLITAVNHHFWFQNCYSCPWKRYDVFSWNRNYNDIFSLEKQIHSNDTLLLLFLLYLLFKFRGFYCLFVFKDVRNLTELLIIKESLDCCCCAQHQNHKQQNETISIK